MKVSIVLPAKNESAAIGQTLAQIQQLQLAHKHVVKTGESLSGLAEQYRVSKKALRNRNNLKSDNLLIGQVIIIPTI
jgi:LysM repeat protein